MIYLASQSPRRRQLLRQIGVPFQLLTGEIDETPQAGEQGKEYVLRMAKQKAQAAWERVQGQQLTPYPVLTADTSVVFGETIFGKPENKAHACDMLKALGGKTHQVLTAVAMMQGDQFHPVLSTTYVTMMPISEALAQRYVATGEADDKAGAYAIQGMGAALVVKLEGSYSGTVGLPLQETTMLLEKFNIPLWQQTVSDEATVKPEGGGNENYTSVAPARSLTENSARSEDCEKLRIKISASEDNSEVI
ncbi:Maf family protein [Candidatus Sororendozoicomonas aggregata]|uniref:Maf family protein n=1 Tax=Candidatus Sororendozoicomonas aggregata TaxID=3073239 RepID=UPI002ED214D0